MLKDVIINYHLQNFPIGVFSGVVAKKDEAFDDNLDIISSVLA